MLKLKVAQSCHKRSRISFYSKSNVFKDPKKSPYIWAYFKRNLGTKNFKKSPNPVTLILTLIFSFFRLQSRTCRGVQRHPDLPYCPHEFQDLRDVNWWSMFNFFVGNLNFPLR